jgi:hypothetical protein
MARQVPAHLPAPVADPTICHCFFTSLPFPCSAMDEPATVTMKPIDFLTFKKYNMTLQQRYAAPTPKFFKKISQWGLLLAAVGGALVAGPVALPVIVAKIAGYLTVAGAVATAVSQAATPVQEENE